MPPLHQTTERAKTTERAREVIEFHRGFWVETDR